MNTFLSSSNTFDEEENIYVYQLHLLSGEQKNKKGGGVKRMFKGQGKGSCGYLVTHYATCIFGSSTKFFNYQP